VPADTPRCDAGLGLWLKGDGRGGFVAVSGTESGLEVYGEQRGAAVCDYDEDGRVDWVVTQNGAATKLYHNRGAKPGLRVRAAGPPGNPDGVGAAMRLIFGARPGPVREIHAAAGIGPRTARCRCWVCRSPDPSLDPLARRQDFHGADPVGSARGSDRPSRATHRAPMITPLSRAESVASGRCLFDASTMGKPQPRSKNLLRLSAHHATPSPLNGERAGVRGVTNPGVLSDRDVLVRFGDPEPSGGTGHKAGKMPARPGSWPVSRSEWNKVLLVLCLSLAAGLLPAWGGDWQNAAGHRYQEVIPPRGGKTGFTRLGPDATGVAFTNALAEDRHLTNQILLNGSGVACGDVDGDG